jgi:amino acid transporter
MAAYRFGPATHFSAPSLIPDFSKLATLSAFATIALAFQGLELGPVMGGEIRDPARQIPRATLISCVVIAAIYMAGTASLLIALPASTIDLIGGIPQALSAIGERIGLPQFGPLTAVLVTLGSIGTIAAWVGGMARVPFVVGVDRYLPPALGRLHPVRGTPHIALITQGVLTSLVLLAAVSGSTIHEAYIILIDMTVIMSLLPLCYIMLAFPVLRMRGGGRSSIGAGACWVTGLMGFGVTLLAIVTSMIPPTDDPHPGLFVLKVIGGSVLLIGIGLMFYRHRDRHSAATAHH